MTIYEKLMKARAEFRSMNIQKSGQSQNGFNFFELADIVPAKETVFSNLHLCDTICFTAELASLSLTDYDTGETLVFTSPMRFARLPDANELQSLGGAETYIRRYLYMIVLDLATKDNVDGKEDEDATYTEQVSAILRDLDTTSKKKAAAIIKKLNNGSSAYRDVEDPETQQAILKELKEAFHG